MNLYKINVKYKAINLYSKFYILFVHNRRKMIKNLTFEQPSESIFTVAVAGHSEGDRGTQQHAACVPPHDSAVPDAPVSVPRLPSPAGWQAAARGGTAPAPSDRRP